MADNNTPQAPTGDIKIFIDKFNTELDIAIKGLSDIQSNLKNIYADAIAITRPRMGTWPKDASVKTIGDLFKYTFPDITKETFISPPKYIQSNGVSSYIDESKKADYDSWKEDFKTDPTINEMFNNIKSGLNANKKIEDYNEIKKPGVTNPSLYSAGQYWFDIFMKNVLDESGPIFGEGSSIHSYAKDIGLSASISLFSTSGDIEDGKLDYKDFFEYIILDIDNDIRNSTGIDINLKSNSGSGNFSGLRVQYKSGLIDELKKDPKFDIDRGTEVTAANQGYFKRPVGEFIGHYDQILLYKAMIQAGDNYKPIVLPLRELKVETSTPDLISPPLPVTKPDTQEITFNVEKKDTFIVVGGTVSPPLELIIVPNDGTDYIFEDFKQLNIDELSDEYTEGEFMGSEEDIWTPPPAQGYPSVDTETLNSLKGVDPNNPGNLTTDSDAKYPVSKDKDANIKELINQAKKAGVTNKYAIVAMLAIISKESGFVPKSEFSYRNTSGARCIKIFGKRGLTEQQWDELRKDDVKFFNFIYGNKYGNGSSDGYKYRGRGLNQITFKAIYEKYGKATGYDIVSDPDLLNTITVAAACAVEYFKSGINGAPSNIKSQYNFTNINSFKNLDDATGAMYHCNAGFGHSYSSILADSTGGRAKAFKNAGPLYNTYSSQIA